MADMMLAHRQWLSRTPDESFANLDSLERFVVNRQSLSHERDDVPLSGLKVIPTDSGDLRIGNNAGTIGFTNWSFSQLTTKIKTPGDFLKELPAQMAADVLNERIRQFEGMKVQLLGQGDTLRAITSPRYGRIWDSSLVSLVKKMIEGTGFTNPMMYPVGGVFGGTKVPGGLFASDRDCFMVLQDETKVIEVNGEKLHRAFAFYNSEVGARVIGGVFMLLREICGNLMFHGMKEIFSFKAKHIGDSVENRVRLRFAEAAPKLLNAGTGNEEAAIRKAMEFRDWTTRDEAIEFLVEKGDFTKKLSEKAIDAADLEEGHHDTLWNLVQGLTAVARQAPNMDTHMGIAMQAGRLLQRYTN